MAQDGRLDEAQAGERGVVAESGQVLAVAAEARVDLSAVFAFCAAAQHGARDHTVHGGGEKGLVRAERRVIGQAHTEGCFDDGVVEERGFVADTGG